jgi:AraC-like DNA-binding protein
VRKDTTREASYGVDDVGEESGASTAPSHLYMVGSEGHIFSYSTYPDATAAPLFAILGISVGDGPLGVRIDGTDFVGPVCLTAPVTSQVKPCRDKTVSFVYYPLSAVHRASRKLPAPRVKMLSRDLFRQYDEQLVSAAEGMLLIHAAQSLFDAVSQCALRELPPVEPLDERVGLAAAALANNTRLEVGELASIAGLSRGRLSHLFTEVVGIDLRRYRLWLKISMAMSLIRAGKTLTNAAHSAGFTDSAHFSNAIKEVYGGDPSRFLEGMVIHGPAESSTRASD